MKPRFKNFVNQLFRSELLRGASLLFTGTVIAQAISILLQPFLRRYFPVEAYGSFSVYSSLVGIIAVISSLKFDDAIVLPDKDEDSIALIGISLFFSFIINLLLLLTICLFGEDIVKLLRLPVKHGLQILILVPVGAFLYTFYQSLNNWLIRKKRFLDVSVNKLIRRSSEGISQVSFALAGVFKGLVYSDIIGQFLNALSTAFMGFKHGLTIKKLNKGILVSAFKLYFDFPKYYLIPSFMSACSFLLPVVIINRLFSADYAGYFDMTKVILSIPIAFVTTSFSGVLLQKTSEKYLKGESIVNELRPVLYIVLAVCIVEFLVIMPFGVAIFKFVFGNKYEMSGIISKILVWSFAFNFFVSTFSSLFISMRRIKLYSAWQLIYFLGILSLGLFRNLEFVSFLKIYVIIEVICYAIVTFFMIAILLKYERSIKV